MALPVTLVQDGANGITPVRGSPKGETPKDKAEKAPDPELAAYLGNRQHYQMIQREDQETTV